MPEDQRRQACLSVLKDAGIMYLWEPKTDERLEQIVFASGLKPRAKEVLDGIRYL